MPLVAGALERAGIFCHGASTVIRSRGKAIWTGRARPWRKKAKDFASSAGRSCGAATVALKPVKPPMVSAWLGSSWICPSAMPEGGRLPTLETTSMGMESEKAWAMGVAAFSSPGPAMRKQTPGRPEALA